MATSITSATSWHAYPSCEFSTARAATLQSEVYQYFTHLPIIQLLEECSVAEAGLPIPGGALLLGQVKQLGLAGRQFFSTENASPQTTTLHLSKKRSPALRPVNRGHRIVLQGKVCSHCFAWGMFMQHVVSILLPTHETENENSFFLECLKFSQSVEAEAGLQPA